MNSRRKVIEKLWPRILKANYWLFSRGSVLIVLGVGFYFTITMIVDLKRDTTSLTNAAFAILASLAALSFSWSRAIGASDTGDNAGRACYAGECFLHAALLMLLASILKYATMALIPDGTASPPSPVYFRILKSVLGVFVSFLFGWGFLTAHTGLRVVNEMLWARIARYRDWDDLA